MKCQGMIPAHDEPVPVDIEVENENGETVVTTGVEMKTVPAKPCNAEATFLARSMKQQKCNLYGKLANPEEGLHFVKDKDVAYCAAHFEPGTMTYLDGREAKHGMMSIEDAG